jgi:hypothetical protein
VENSIARRIWRVTLITDMTRVVWTLLLVGSLAGSADAQFRRGLGDAREVTLFPIEPPAMLLPSNATVEVVVRNTSSAPARIADRVNSLLGRQLTDNDPRVRLAERDGDLVVTATLTEFTESRRNSTKYVSETRQVGTRQVTDKNGKTRTEPIYEYGRNRPSVVIRANAAVRIEVRRRQGGSSLADETARHSVSEEHIADQNPPSRDAIEDQLIDNVIRKAAGRISPGRQPVNVLLARSDEVDRFNDLARNRRWQDWEASLLTVKPHRDRKRDAYRLHNLAVAQESLAYEAAEVEDALNHLARAREIITQASAQHPDEKYITESVTRINSSEVAYRQVAALQQQMNTRASDDSAAPVETKRAAARPAPSGAGGDTITNADIIDLRAAGLDDDNLIATIKAAKAAKFDLSPAGLRALLLADVSNRVITAMRERK